MGQRLAVVVALALSAAACRDGSSNERPVAKAGRVVTVADDDDFEKSGLHLTSDLAVGPDGALYVIEDRSATVGEEPGHVANLWLIPPRGSARVIAGIPRARDKVRNLDPADVIDPSPRLAKRSLSMSALAVGPDGTLFVGDRNNTVVWALGQDGRGRIVAGTGQKGFSGDGGPATAAMIDIPDSLVVNQANGDLYIATVDNRVRKVDVDGVITTVAGDGTVGSDGDGGPAIKARLRDVSSMAVDSRTGDLYFCDGQVIRKVHAAGTISRVAGNDTEEKTPTPAGRPAVDGAISCRAVDVDPRDGVVYFSDGTANQIRRITRAGVIEVVAGTGGAGRTANGKQARSTPIDPTHMAVDRQGNIFFVSHAGGTTTIQMVGAERPLD